MTPISKNLEELIEKISAKVATEDLGELRSACKDDVIDNDEMAKTETTREWLEYLVGKKLLTEDNPSFIEHVFELCRRPDLLTVVLEYRMDHLVLKDETELGHKLMRVSSAKKYFAPNLASSIDNETNFLKLAAPPKPRRKSAY